MVAWWPGRPSMRPAFVRRPNSDLMGDIMGGSFSGRALRRLSRGMGSCERDPPVSVCDPASQLAVLRSLTLESGFLRDPCSPAMIPQEVESEDAIQISQVERLGRS